MNGYKLSKAFWDYAFENPGKIKPTHTAVFFFALELCNRLGWKESFGLPTTTTMEAVGIGAYKTYKRVLDELAEIGFFKIIQFSKNQYTANIIALVELTKAHTKASTKALDKALTEATTKADAVYINLETNINLEKPIKTIEVDDVDKRGSKYSDEERDELLNHFNGKDEEKEKNLAPKKEKVLPATEEMIEKIVASETCHWWNVIEFYLAKGVKWNKLTEAERLPYYDHRAELFKKFYASKQDNYKIRLPSTNEIANNFYNWIPSELNREKLQTLNQHAIAKSNGNYKTRGQRQQDKRNELDDLKAASTDFLRRTQTG